MIFHPFFFLLQLANVLQIDLQLVKVRFCCEVKIMFLCFLFIFCLLQMKEKKNLHKKEFKLWTNNIIILLYHHTECCVSLYPTWFCTQEGCGNR